MILHIHVAPLISLPFWMIARDMSGFTWFLKYNKLQIFWKTSWVWFGSNSIKLLRLLGVIMEPNLSALSFFFLMKMGFCSKLLWLELLSKTRRQNESIATSTMWHKLCIFKKNLPKRFWGECMLIVGYLINQTPSSLLQETSPFELLHGHTPSYSQINICDCLAYVIIYQRISFELIVDLLYLWVTLMGRKCGACMILRIKIFLSLVMLYLTKQFFLTLFENWRLLETLLDK